MLATVSKPRICGMGKWSHGKSVDCWVCSIFLSPSLSSFSVYPCLLQNSLYSEGWSQTQISTCLCLLSAMIKGVCHHFQASPYFFFQFYKWKLLWCLAVSQLGVLYTSGLHDRCLSTVIQPFFPCPLPPISYWSKGSFMAAYHVINPSFQGIISIWIQKSRKSVFSSSLFLAALFQRISWETSWGALTGGGLFVLISKFVLTFHLSLTFPGYFAKVILTALS